MIGHEDTICAPATVAGTGAISIIRVSGKETFTVADRCIICRKGKISDAQGYTVRFGTIFREDGKVLDEVLVSIFRAPNSYTGENSVEISCHASSYIVSAILELLYKAGTRAAGPGEFTQRAFLNGKMDLAQAEAVADVIAAQNEAAHRIAFNQMKGGFSNELKDIRSSLLEIVSLMELELDFSEEDVEFADRQELDALLEEAIAHTSRLIDSFRLGNAIKNGVPVAIAGATNTGKSTLLNTLLGEDRAIVSDIHGTTRDTIEEILNIDGVLFRFIDTAGIRETVETVEKIGIERTFRKISQAAVILGMIDLSADVNDTREIVRQILGKTDLDAQQLIFLLNKTDIAESSKAEMVYELILSEVNEYGAGAKAGQSADISIAKISAKTGQGINELRTMLADSQRNLVGDADVTLVTNQRHAQALSATNTALLRVREGLAQGLPSDLAAQDIREAIYHLGSIVGEISTDEVLGNIFANFCIGK